MTSHSLVERLPPEVFRRSASILTRYSNYPVFSWPWFWRRSALFVLLPIAFTSVGTSNVGLLSGNAALAIGYAWRAFVALLIVVTLGPAIGTLVRHSQLKVRLERWILPVVIVLSIAAGVTALRWFGAYFDKQVTPTMSTQVQLSEQAKRIGARDGVRATNFVLLIAFVSAVGGGFALVAYFTETRRLREYRQQQELLGLREARDNADRKLSVLQAQVEPHFLYNTLASVRSLVNTDPARAVATIDALVDHLRATLPKMRERDDARATLAEQIEICRSYLEVMRVRMGTRFRYSIQVPENCGSLFFPPLMLISLVENAIKHGVEPKPGACFISIAARRLSVSGGEQLEVSVIDDGAGLREGAGGGIGLANIRAQLAARYQDRAELSLEGRDTGGVGARITIPIEHS